MGVPVLILGASGSGKSSSLRNFSPKEIGIYNVASKPLPFKNGKNLTVSNCSDYTKIKESIVRGYFKSYAIDDSQYLLAFQSFAKAKITGYGKFTDMAVDFYNLIQTVITRTPEDCIVYFLHHTELADDGQTIKAKTIGKMLDSQLTVEGLFSIVLLTQIINKRHVFITQSDGTNTAKSPMDMLPYEMDNDLKAVDTAIRKYYFEEDKK